MFNSVPCFQYSGWGYFNDENGFNTDFPELALKRLIFLGVLIRAPLINESAIIYRP